MAAKKMKMKMKETVKKGAMPKPTAAAKTGWTPRSNKRVKTLSVKKGQKFYSFRKAAELLKTTHQTISKYVNDLKLTLAYESRQNTLENKFMITPEQIKVLKEYASTIKRGRPTAVKAKAKPMKAKAVIPKKRNPTIPTPVKRVITKTSAPTKAKAKSRSRLKK